jgi:hypothetical protein
VFERKIYTYVNGTALFGGTPYTVPVADNRFLGYTWCGMYLSLRAALLLITLTSKISKFAGRWTRTGLTYG